MAHTTRGASGRPPTERSSPSAGRRPIRGRLKRQAEQETQRMLTRHWSVPPTCPPTPGAPPKGPRLANAAAAWYGRHWIFQTKKMTAPLLFFFVNQHLRPKNSLLPVRAIYDLVDFSGQGRRRNDFSSRNPRIDRNEPLCPNLLLRHQHYYYYYYVHRSIQNVDAAQTSKTCSCLA